MSDPRSIEDVYGDNAEGPTLGDRKRLSREKKLLSGFAMATHRSESDTGQIYISHLDYARVALANVERYPQEFGEPLLLGYIEAANAWKLVGEQCQALLNKSREIQRERLAAAERFGWSIFDETELPLSNDIWFIIIGYLKKPKDRVSLSVACRALLTLVRSCSVVLSFSSLGWGRVAGGPNGMENCRSASRQSTIKRNAERAANGLPPLEYIEDCMKMPRCNTIVVNASGCGQGPVAVWQIRDFVVHAIEKFILDGNNTVAFNFQNEAYGPGLTRIVSVMASRYPAIWAKIDLIFVFSLETIAYIYAAVGAGLRMSLHESKIVLLMRHPDWAHTDMTTPPFFVYDDPPEPESEDWDRNGRDPTAPMIFVPSVEELDVHLSFKSDEMDMLKFYRMARIYIDPNETYDQKGLGVRRYCPDTTIYFPHEQIPGPLDVPAGVSEE